MISVLAGAQHGPSDARDIVLRFVIPDGFRVLREPSSATMTCSGSAETGYECTAAQLARFGTDDVLLVLEPVDSPSALTFADSVRGSVGDDTPGNNQATATASMTHRLRRTGPRSLRAAALAVGYQAFPATKSSLLFGSAVLLFSTALRHVRRLRRGRLFRNR